MTPASEFEKARDEACPGDLNYRPECSEWKCGAIASWKEGANWAHPWSRAWTLKNEPVVKQLREALEEILEAEIEENKVKHKKAGLEKGARLIGGNYRKNAAYYAADNSLAAYDNAIKEVKE